MAGRITNHDYEGVFDLMVGDYVSSKYQVSFRINFDWEPPIRETRTDPSWPAEARVNSVHIAVNGAEVECPDWLERLILDAVDEETLADFADPEDENAFV